MKLSLPTRGAWIEIRGKGGHAKLTPCRSPRGERGLKYECALIDNQIYVSLPTRGAWIEILKVSAR